MLAQNTSASLIQMSPIHGIAEDPRRGGGCIRSIQSKQASSARRAYEYMPVYEYSIYEDLHGGEGARICTEWYYKHTLVWYVGIGCLPLWHHLDRYKAQVQVHVADTALKQ